MSYVRPTVPSNKELLADYNRKQYQAFKLNPNSTKIEIYPVSIIPGVLTKAKPDLYTKETKALNENCSIDIIKKNGKFESFVWHTNANQIKEATRFGIVNTYSVTGKVIAALGKYCLITLDRIKNGQISNRYILKDKLLRLYQERFEALHELESLANQNCSLEEFSKRAAEYIQNLENIKNNLTPLFAGTNFLDVDREGIVYLQKEISTDIKRITDFMKHYSFEPSNRATGIDSVLTFNKVEMVRNLRKLQNHNQNITYSRKMYFAATRGDLNSCIEDAEKVIEDYSAPPRDAVSDEHHGLYGSDKERIAYDSSFHCHDAHQREQALLAITFIEEMNKIDFADKQHPTIVTNDKKSFPLEIVRATKWGVGGKLSIGLKRALAWIANVSIKLVAGIVELPLTVLIEPLTFGYALPFFQGVRKLATFEIHIKNPKAPLFWGSELLNEVRPPRESLGMRVKHLLFNACKNTFNDLFYGVRDVYKRFTVNLFDDIKNDYWNGSKNKHDLKAVLDACNNDIKIIHKEKTHHWELIKNNINIKNKKAIQWQAEDFKTDETFAIPSFIPSAGEFNDILNAGADGAEQFMAFFLHNVHAKHPFIGSIFSLSYLSGGLAVILPKYVAFLGSPYLRVTFHSTKEYLIDKR